MLIMQSKQKLGRKLSLSGQKSRGKTYIYVSKGNT
jgi:hypothetical protein